MAKRKKTSPQPSHDHIIAHTKTPYNTWQPSTTTHSSIPTRLPRGVALARAKRTSPPTPSSITLSTHFQSLPPELRAQIFAHILVRPSKWTLAHHPSCPLRAYSSTTDVSPSPPPGHACVKCHDSSDSAWLIQEKWRQPSWTHPWRSVWAPEKRNAYMCSPCWDANFRPEGRPLPPRRWEGCLCARREKEALTVLLVCRQWHAEAGRVFYARNTFCFESCSNFVAFISNLSPRWRDVITSISILLAEHTTSVSGTGNPNSNLTSEPSAALSRTLSLLRSLLHLTHLELDAAFLTHEATIHRLLRLGLRQTRRICFVVPTRPSPQNRIVALLQGSEDVWPAFRAPGLLVGGLAEEVARGMKGQRRMWLKKRGGEALGRAVARERERGGDGVEGREVREESGEIYCDDDLEWVRILREVGAGHQRAFLVGRRYVEREGHWREWRAESGRMM